MDILSHGLWGATIVRRRKLVWWAFLSGMLPDVLGGGVGFVYLLSVGEFWGRGTWQLLPDWAKASYAFHHSLLGAGLYFLLLLLFLPDYRILILPYLLHIIMDTFVHANDMIGRLLYPLSVNSGLHGLNWWEHWWILALNIFFLVSINVILFFRRWRNASNVPSKFKIGF